MPRVSIIMPFLDPHPQYFEQAIDSVLAQTFTDWELILVDDGSGPPSRRLAERCVAEHPDLMRLLDSGPLRPMGISAARNAGIAAAGGDFIAMLDSDDIYLPERLTRHVEVLNANPDVGMVVSDALWWYSWGNPPEKGDEHRSAGVRPGIVEPPRYLTRILRYRSEEPQTSAFTVRRQVLEMLGPYEREWRGLYEDQVLTAKVLSHYAAYYLPGIDAQYRQHHASFTRSTPLEDTVDVRRVFLAWVEQYTIRKAPAVHRQPILSACRRAYWLVEHPWIEYVTRRFWKLYRRAGAARQ